jgi:malonyl-CoA/methylmalonyl-CoA synthetase
VAESSVVGVQDEKWGEKIVAAVVKKHGADVSATDIQAYCKKHLHDWKCPKKIFFANRNGVQNYGSKNGVNTF